MSVINVYPTGGKWPRDVPPKLLAVPDRHPGDVLTGVNLVSGTLRRIVKADATRSTIIGFIAVLVLMFISFRNREADAADVRAVRRRRGGDARTDGAVRPRVQLHEHLRRADDHRRRDRLRDLHAAALPAKIPPAFRGSAHETGKAIVMAALTAIVGYGSFAFSHYPGLRSIGYASTFGIGLSGLAAITLLPAILVLGRRNDERRTTTIPARAS